MFTESIRLPPLQKQISKMSIHCTSIAILALLGAFVYFPVLVYFFSKCLNSFGEKHVIVKKSILSVDYLTDDSNNNTNVDSDGPFTNTEIYVLMVAVVLIMTSVIVCL